MSAPTTPTTTTTGPTGTTGSSGASGKHGTTPPVKKNPPPAKKPTPPLSPARYDALQSVLVASLPLDHSGSVHNRAAYRTACARLSTRDPLLHAFRTLCLDGGYLYDAIIAASSCTDESCYTDALDHWADTSEAFAAAYVAFDTVAKRQISDVGCRTALGPPAGELAGYRKLAAALRTYANALRSGSTSSVAAARARLVKLPNAARTNRAELADFRAGCGVAAVPATSAAPATKPATPTPNPPLSAARFAAFKSVLVASVPLDHSSTPALRSAYRSACERLTTQDPLLSSARTWCLAEAGLYDALAMAAACTSISCVPATMDASAAAFDRFVSAFAALVRVMRGQIPDVRCRDAIGPSRSELGDYSMLAGGLQGYAAALRSGKASRIAAAAARLKAIGVTDRRNGGSRTNTAELRDFLAACSPSG